MLDILMKNMTQEKLCEAPESQKLDGFMLEPFEVKISKHNSLCSFIPQIHSSLNLKKLLEGFFGLLLKQELTGFRTSIL